MLRRPKFLREPAATAIATGSVRERLIGGFVVAGFAARLAVHQAVGAHTYVDYGLAQAAVLLALAGVFRLLALGTPVFAETGSGTHGANVAPDAIVRK